MTDTFLTSEKHVEILIAERDKVLQRGDMIFKALSAFNPIVISVATGLIAYVASGSRGPFVIPSALAVYSQIFLALGGFNMMLFAWSTVEGKYADSLELRIDSLSESPIFREFRVRDHMTGKSGMKFFLMTFITFIASTSIVAGFYSFFVFLKGPFHWMAWIGLCIVSVQLILLGLGCIQLFRYSKITHRTAS